MFLQSTCYQHQACLVTLADVHADNNTAHLAGSLLYTTSPSNLQAYPAGLLDATASPAIGMQPPVASFPSSFHLQPPRHHGQDHAAAGNSYNGTTAGPLQYTGTTARECGVLPVQPLGEDPFTAVVFTGEVFSLDVFVLDAYGSVVASGPGSEWVLRLEPNQRRTSVDSDPAQLKGSLVATAAQGVARFGNLSVVGSPGSTLQMQVVARNADALSGGMGGQPVRVWTCLRPVTMPPVVRHPTTQPRLTPVCLQCLPCMLTGPSAVAAHHAAVEQVLAWAEGRRKHQSLAWQSRC